MVHAAARNIIVSTRNPREDFEVNIGGTLNVLLAARDADVKRVVYTSSCSIYGNPRPPDQRGRAGNLLSPYAVSKFGGEPTARRSTRATTCRPPVVRYSNVFGPGQRPDNPYCGVVAKFFASALAGEPLRSTATASRRATSPTWTTPSRRPCSHASRPRPSARSSTSGPGARRASTSSPMRSPASPGADLEPAHVDRRDIDNIRRRVVSIEKIRRELRWVTSVTLENGLERTYAWLVDEQRTPTRASGAPA